MTFIFFLCLTAQDSAGKIMILADDDVQCMNADGSDLRNITGDQKELREESPAWSPDGKWIAYVAGKGMSTDLYLIHADGTGKRILAAPKGGAKFSRPVWSPDGKRIACGLGFVKIALAVVEVETGSVKKLTSDENRAYAAAWSPDSRRIAFLLEEKEGSGWAMGKVAVVNVDGSNLQKLTSHDRRDKAVSWSPDGKSFAVAARIDGGPYSVYVMDADGGNRKELVEPRWGPHYRNVQWSPDGARLLLMDGNDKVCVMNRDGSGMAVVAKGSDPSWSPVR